MKQFALVLVALAVLTPTPRATAEGDWLTGVVVEVSKGRTDTGAIATTTTSPSVSTPTTAVDTGGVIVVSGGDQGPTTSTTTATATGVDYTDYVVRVGNKLFVMRPDPEKPKESRKVRVLRNVAHVLDPTTPAAPNPVPVTIPVNVGEKVMIAPFGDRAWVRHGNRQFACTVVRQVLLSAPAEEKQDNATQTAPPAKTDSATDRPTLRRDPEKQ
jgi:hypothetical protein